MIPHLVRDVLDLGRDRERITEEDACRQHRTTDRILQAFFGPPPSRCEVQLLADEVGLGKTFVALAVAYAILDALRRPRSSELPSELHKCYRAVVVVAPAGPLAEKWHREVEALRTRCTVAPGATDWFRSKLCTTPEELLVGLRQAGDPGHDPAKAPCVLISSANLFTRKLHLAGERLRFLAACLFRWWGSKLNKAERYQIVRRAANVRGYGHWAGCARWVSKGEYEVDLWDFKAQERYLDASDSERQGLNREEQHPYAQTPFSYGSLGRALDRFARTEEGEAFFCAAETCVREGEAEPRGLLPYCKWSADRKRYPEWYFNGFKDRLLNLYRHLLPYLITIDGRDLPLIVADEAHHWRNGERQDCQAFRRFLAPFTRRLLLLTATPFQLHRDELLSMVSPAESMEPAIGADRIEALKERFGRIEAAMRASEEAGREFSKEWGELGEQMVRLDPGYSAVISRLPAEEDPRTGHLKNHWARLRALPSQENESGLQQIPGLLRPFFRRALGLREANRRLQEVMAPLVIRHRRQTEHRRYWIGKEYPPLPGGQHPRPDRSQLHLAPGRALPPHAELAQYLLMKVVAELSRGQHRTALGIDLTGCYTTLWQSQEGTKAVGKALTNGPSGLLGLLQRITGHDRPENPCDAEHPKVEIVVKEVLQLWDRGEKSLVFCFRVPTAEVLHRLLTGEVEKRLRKARKALLELRGRGSDAGENRAMQQFRRSLTAREGSGVPLFLDRVLLGWLVANGVAPPRLRGPDYRALAQLCARAISNGRPLFRDFSRPDRVFLHRAVEHVLACRLLAENGDCHSLTPHDPGATRELLEQMAQPEWVRFRHGDERLTPAQNGKALEEDGVEHIARSSLSAVYELQPQADPTIVSTAFASFEARPSGGRPRTLDTLITGPNLFVPLGDVLQALPPSGRQRAGRMRDLLFRMTRPAGVWDWPRRVDVLDAINRAFLREDILLRLPRDIFTDTEESWSAGLFRGLHRAPRGSAHREPLAARIEEFLRELQGMGVAELEAHLRYAMNSRAQAVALVTGVSSGDREAIFNGFNTPLLPDILICTQVGQEGIDLHRHCRHVVHYDLGWNPAAVEQRTGRVDRLGCKAVRERKLAQEEQGNVLLPEEQLPGLDIALPYLAGTYDERMFDRLRTRA